MLERARRLNDFPAGPGSVVYWMDRDQRAEDNWALLFASKLATDSSAPLLVLFSPTITPAFTLRRWDFLLRGLQETEKRLLQKNLPLICVPSNPVDFLPSWLADQSAGQLVTDFNPLRHKQRQNLEIASRISIPFFEVDAHNIIPCWTASAKQEFGAYTLRPKIHRLLPHFLEEFPPLPVHPVSANSFGSVDWKKVQTALQPDPSVLPIEFLQAGAKAGYELLRHFLENKLSKYAVDHNNPVVPGTSSLSPYLNFGQLSAQRVALELLRENPIGESSEAFLEQLIVRRELADNFSFNNPAYDSYDGFPLWSRATLEKHWSDLRTYRYSREIFESAATHDPIWNAAQHDILAHGKLHGYMRMYWAKKILEWSRDASEAMQIATYLNDRYQLDGCDPNGYAGIAWSIGGIHDRPWPERSIFGKIRYMNDRGLRRKFDVDQYIRNVYAKGEHT